MHFGSRRRRVSQKRKSHPANAAQIQRLDSRILLTEVTGGTAVFVESDETRLPYGWLTPGDFDGDGDIDLFNSRERGTIWLNDGSSHFDITQQNISGAGHLASDTEVADLDGDGDLDVFQTNSDGFPHVVMFNDGLGQFTVARVDVGTGRMEGVDLGDVDGDGDIDAVIVSPEGPGLVLKNDGSGVFTSSSSTVATDYALDVQLNDIDSDGDLDAILYLDHGPAVIWKNQGGGSFTKTNQRIGSQPSRSLSFGDVDGDGDLDALTTGNRSDNGLEVWLNSGTGTFSYSGQRIGSREGTMATLGDLDGDGDLDAVATLENGKDGPTVFLNDGTGRFTDSGQTLGNKPPREMALADLDGDGDLDLWQTVSSQGKSIWLNQNQPIQHVVDLPDPGEPFETYFEVIVDAEELVVRELRRDLGVTELFRQAQTEVTRLQINGGDGDDRLIVNFSGGNPIPVSGLEFNASDESNGDSLIIGTGSVSSVSHTFSSHSDGSVIIDGALLTYTGVEPVTDSLSADRRYFSYTGTTDAVILDDNGTEADGISQISGSGRVLEFPNPSTRLKINGSSGDDSIMLTAMDALFAGDVSAEGLRGDDRIIVGQLDAPVKLFGGVGHDTLIGGMKDDLLDGTSGDDVLNGRGGNDALHSGYGDDLLFGGAGQDLLDGFGGDDRLFGQGGNGDTLIGSRGTDTLNGGAGRDWLVDRLWDATVILTDSEMHAGTDIDSIISIELAELNEVTTLGRFIDASEFSGQVTLGSGSGDDTLIGGSNDDLLIGGGGNDSLTGGGGNDWLDGGDGDDTLNGGDGNDSLSAGSGNDALAGMSGNDWLNGNAGRDMLLGGDGDDTLLGGGHIDTLMGEDGDDFLKGHAGDDLVSGGGQGATASVGDFVDGENIDYAFTVDAAWAQV